MQRDLTGVNVVDMGNGIFIVMYNLNIGAVVSISSIIPLSSYPLGLAVPSTNCANFSYHAGECF